MVDTVQNNKVKCAACKFIRGVFAASMAASWAEMITIPLDTAKVRF
jgi:hypothetical protein